MRKTTTPVVLVVFNRPQTTQRVFDAVAKARPERLLIIADGPRSGRPEDTDRCASVRKVVSKVDWPCEVELNFADHNMGCRRRIVSGLDWAFSIVEEAIILEDDCLPDQSFFPFCSELLDRYRDRNQIGFVAGFNPLEEEFDLPYSYFFSLMTSIWGWATWRRAWQQYDEFLRDWPDVKENRLLHLLFREKKIVDYWSNIFDKIHEGKGPDTWDYQWLYTCWTQNWVSILPRRNLIQNIGAGAEATHTTSIAPELLLGASELEWPLFHPPAIAPWPKHASSLQAKFFTPSVLRRMERKLRFARFRESMLTDDSVVR